jgi:hypothetical protein
MPSEIERLRMRLERVPRNQAGAQFCERSFLFSWKMSVEIFCYDKLENSIAQKFQALIVFVIPLFFVAETGMGQRLLEQSGIAKLVAEALLERFHVNVFEKQPAT